MKKVLVVDDSALMRRVLSRILIDGGFDVVTARNGVDALATVDREHPDVVTLDVNMPEMDGLTFLSRLMAERPTPVVMVSSLTEEGAAATFEALELGAVDFIHKPDGTVSLGLSGLEKTIVAKVRAAVGARIRRSRGLSGRLRTQREARKPMPARIPSLDYIVLVGVSTGGPGTLEEVLAPLPPNFPGAVVIAQHMPAGFTLTLAQRLDGICPMTVVEVSGTTALAAGHVYLGRGDADVIFLRRGFELCVTSAPADRKLLWHPSVSRMVSSAVQHFAPEQLIGVQLTGMGNDGAVEMAELHRRGGRTVAEAEETAVVFGMPKELIALGGATAVLPSHRIGKQLARWAGLGPMRLAV